MNLEYMNLAYKEAQKALKNNEVPVGAVIVKNDEVIAKAYNKKEKRNCALEHAEMIAIRKASKKLNNWRLEDCDIYITLAPCPMCASALKQARIKNIYCGLSNLDENTQKIVENILNTSDINPKVNFKSDLSPESVDKLLKLFFKGKRIK